MSEFLGRRRMIGGCTLHDEEDSTAEELDDEWAKLARPGSVCGSRQIRPQRTDYGSGDSCDLPTRTGLHDFDATIVFEIYGTALGCGA